MTDPVPVIHPGNAELLQTATEYLLTAIAAVDEGDLGDPTRCTDWSIGDVLLHLINVAESLHKLADMGTFELSDCPLSVADILRVAPERARALTDRLTGDAGTLDPQGLANPEWANNAAISGAVEFTTHGWDISAALGQAHRISDPQARALLAITSEAIDSTARDPHFAPPVHVDASQPPSDQLVGFLGRDPHPPVA
ncbi:MAG: TIGR03086 family metal-binding protein [Aquihabitans sp.]